ncbi:transposase-like protein [Deinococcus humi]|uniref:Transposase-like protein n=1 Tax=Deinococcus humi TaxID=662880 RepID=A0A7W8JYQ1_9DEIO|nr:transposase-like protein [Deinococcus humi]GGO35808.1 hypothetical protein GCM10008949_38840 [Deinococcus humi]
MTHWLWRAADEYGAVLDGLLQTQRDTGATKSFLIRLLGKYTAPEAIHTDQLRSYSAPIRELLVLCPVEHQEGAYTARCNNLVK